MVAIITGQGMKRPNQYRHGCSTCGNLEMEMELEFSFHRFPSPGQDITQVSVFFFHQSHVFFLSNNHTEFQTQEQVMV